MTHAATHRSRRSLATWLRTVDSYTLWAFNAQPELRNSWHVRGR